jgi:hypothetical protein
LHAGGDFIGGFLKLEIIIAEFVGIWFSKRFCLPGMPLWRIQSFWHDFAQKGQFL